MRGSCKSPRVYTSESKVRKRKHRKQSSAAVSTIALKLPFDDGDTPGVHIVTMIVSDFMKMPLPQKVHHTVCDIMDITVPQI
eukprot:6472896-Amphidinium_carterae.1